MAKSSRVKRRAKVRSPRRNRGPVLWYVLTALVVVVGVIAIVAFRDDAQAEAPRANRDHWHAAFGVNVCGTWLPNAPEFHSAADNANVTAGVHSHGDGLIHIHPYVSAEAGDNATVGRFLEYGGWSADRDSFEVWDGQVHRTGDECGEGDDAREAVVRWEVNGEPREGDISDYKPADGDVIALALLPEDEEIGEPPSAGNTPVDLAPQPGVTAPAESAPAGTASSSVPDASASTSSTAPAGASTSVP